MSPGTTLTLDEFSTVTAEGVESFDTTAKLFDAVGFLLRPGEPKPSPLPPLVWLRLLRTADEAIPLQIALRVELSTDPDDFGVIAVAPLVRCSGTGTDLASALADLEASILDLWHSLRESPDGTLADDARALKAELARVVG